MTPELVEEKVDVHMDDFAITTDVVLRVITGLFKLQKVLLDPKGVLKCFTKIRDWMKNTFEGDDEEGAYLYL